MQAQKQKNHTDHTSGQELNDSDDDSSDCLLDPLRPMYKIYKTAVVSSFVVSDQ